MENIFDFESIMEVNCKVENKRIIYFLSVPINYKTKFELYLLNPIPSKNEHEYVTIIPNVKYLLKSIIENKIIPLNGVCTKSTKHYQCPSYLTIHNGAKCEEQLLTSGKSDQCVYTPLIINDNHLELINPINQYLAVFSKPEEVQIICQKESVTQKLQGIFLIKKDQCKIKFRNNELPFQILTSGSPSVISAQDLSIKQTNLSDIVIKLKRLNLGKIPVLEHAPVLIEPPINQKLSVWTILIYVVIFATACYLTMIWIKRRRWQPQGSPAEGNSSSPSIFPKMQGSKEGGVM